MNTDDFDKTILIYEKAWHDGAYMKDSALNWVDNIVTLFFPKSKLKSLPENASVLDAGCGAGLFGSSFFRRISNISSITFLDASSAVDVAKKYITNLSVFDSPQFIRSDLKDHLNISVNKYDCILSCGVIHHDLDPTLAFKRLVQGLKPGGYLYLWVYAQTNELRNLTDDYIRKTLAQSEDKQVEVLDEIVSLGKFLHAADGLISIKEDLPNLGIYSGDYSFHEFIHAFLFKAFYNDKFDFERNYLQNLDWFAVPLAKKFTESELVLLSKEAGLEIIDLSKPTRSGFSLIGRLIE
jgi:SAM-dependent methyltransferase